MLSKRPFHVDDGFGVLVPEPKRRFTFKKIVFDVMKDISQKELVSAMETSIRKVVREEMERVIFSYLHSNARLSFNLKEAFSGRCLQLVFGNKLPSPIYTGSRVEAEDGEQIKIVLVDPISKTRVTSGPYSSMKLEILVLDGDFGSDDGENWSQEEFNAKIVKEREGKRPLVTGELSILLKDGVGIIGDVIFTDNSSWIRSRKFRLGVRVLQRNCGEVQIKEARSEAFMVKDHRGELYKKHYPPSLHDEVWRLEKIGKGGKFHSRLASIEIHTVEHLLRMYTVDSTSLCRKIGASNKTWETIVDHAKTCIINNEKLYDFPGDGVRLLFNSIYNVVAATFDGQNYVSPNDLNYHQKLLVENQKKIAYKKVNEFVQMDAGATFGLSNPLPNLQAETLNSPSSILHNPEFPVACQEKQLDFNQASTSTSYNQEATANNHHFLYSTAQNTHPPLQNSFTMDEYFPTSSTVNRGNAWSNSPSSSTFEAVTELSQLQIPSWSPVNAICGQNNNNFFCFKQ